MLQPTVWKTFRVLGIYPFNPDTFQDKEFLPSHVTDRPMATTVLANPAEKLKKLKISLSHQMLIFLSMLLQNIYDRFEKPLPENKKPG